MTQNLLNLVLAIFLCLSPLVSSDCPVDYDPQDGISWYHSSTFIIDPAAVQAGHSIEGMTYVGMYWHTSRISEVAVVVPEKGYCQYYYTAFPSNVTDCYIMTVRPGFKARWAAGDRDNMPKGAVYVGEYVDSDYKQYVGKKWIGDVVSLGDIEISGVAGFPHGDSYTISYFYDILVIEPDGCSEYWPSTV